MSSLTERADRPIAVGDLVQVVRPLPCCGRTTPMQGHIFVVSGFITSPSGHCAKCDAILPEWKAAEGGQDTVWVERLQRFPPLDELESTRTDEPIQEPA